MNQPLSRVQIDYDLEMTLPYLLNRAGVHIGNAFNQEIRRFRLTLPTWRILASLFHADNQRLTELSQHTSIEISTLSRLVVAAQRRGLVARRPSSDDARAIRISLTGAGRDLALQVIPLAQLYERIALAGIDTEETTRLKALLARIYDNIVSLGPLKPPRELEQEPPAKAARSSRRKRA